MSTIQKTFALLAVALTLVLIYFLQPVLAPFLAGAILGYLGDPIVDRLQRRGVNRTIGVMVVFLIFISVLTGALLVLLPMLARESGEFIRRIPLYVVWMQETVSPWLVSNFGIDPFQVDFDELSVQVKDNWQQAGGVIGSLLGQLTRSGFALVSAIGMIGLTPVVAFYIMRDWDVLTRRILEMVPREAEPVFVQLCRECDEVLGAFLRGQLLIMLLLGCIYAAGLYLIGLELALLIGMVAGLASIVPYLGFIVGIIAAAVAAFFQFQDPVYLGYVAVVFAVGQVLEAWVLTPWLVGDKIGLHPVAVIFAVLAGGQLFGFVGVLLALPVAAVVMVFIRHLHISYLQSEYYDQAEKTESAKLEPGTD